MFASGVVKLQSQCPTWWGLTAMPTHYESQCIPTPLAWYAYNVQAEGTIFHKLSVVVTYLTEIPLTLFFFAPTTTLRKLTFVFQIQLMIAIMLTGNYITPILKSNPLKSKEDFNRLLKIWKQKTDGNTIGNLGNAHY